MLAVGDITPDAGSLIAVGGWLEVEEADLMIRFEDEGKYGLLK